MITTEAVITLLKDYETKLVKLMKKHPDDAELMELYFDIKSTGKALSLNLIGGQAAPMSAPAAPVAAAQTQRSKKVKEAEPAPAAPEKPAEPHSQRYVDDKWGSYFDEMYIKVYERWHPKVSTPFYATLTRDGERADVTFGDNIKQLWQKSGRQENYILPSDWELQKRNGYLQVYIRAVQAFGTEKEIENSQRIISKTTMPTPPKRKK